MIQWSERSRSRGQFAEGAPPARGRRRAPPRRHVFRTSLSTTHTLLDAGGRAGVRIESSSPCSQSERLNKRRLPFDAGGSRRHIVNSILPGGKRCGAWRARRTRVDAGRETHLGVEPFAVAQESSPRPRPAGVRDGAGGVREPPEEGADADASEPGSAAESIARDGGNSSTFGSRPHAWQSERVRVRRSRHHVGKTPGPASCGQGAEQLQITVALAALSSALVQVVSEVDGRLGERGVRERPPHDGARLLAAGHAGEDGVRAFVCCENCSPAGVSAKRPRPRTSREHATARAEPRSRRPVSRDACAAEPSAPPTPKPSRRPAAVAGRAAGEAPSSSTGGDAAFQLPASQRSSTRGTRPQGRQYGAVRADPKKESTARPALEPRAHEVGVAPVHPVVAATIPTHQSEKGRDVLRRARRVTAERDALGPCATVERAQAGRWRARRRRRPSCRTRRALHARVADVLATARSRGSPCTSRARRRAPCASRYRGLRSSSSEPASRSARARERVAVMTPVRSSTT